MSIRRSIYKIIVYGREKKKMIWLLTLCLRSCNFAPLWRNRLPPSGAASGGYLASLSLVKLTTLTAFSSSCLLGHVIIQDGFENMGFSFLRIGGFGMVRDISSLMLFARLRCGYSALMSSVSHAPSMSKILYCDGISKSHSKDNLLTLLHEGSL